MKRTYTFAVTFALSSVLAIHSAAQVTPVTMYNNGVATTISSGVTLTIGGNFVNQTSGTDGSVNNQGTIQINGDWTNNTGNNVFTTTGGTTLFYGVSNQSIGGSKETYFNSVTIDKSANDVLLTNNNNRVNNVLTLTNRNIVLGSNTFVLGETSTVSGSPGLGSYLQADGTGLLQKNFNSTGNFTYPIGDVDEYSPLTVNINTASFAGNDFISARVTDAVHPQVTGSDHVTRYWTLSSAGLPSINYDATFSYTDLDVAGFEYNINSARYDGAAWNTYNQAAVLTNTLSTPGVTSAPNNHSFTGFQGSVLPVELSHFTASVEKNTVLLKWSTQSESGSDYYSIERSTNKRDFKEIARVKAKVNTRSTTQYVYTDENILQPVIYYRLKQVDQNGKVSFSKIVYVMNSGSVTPLVTYYNPSAGAVSISLSPVKNAAVDIVISNATGVSIYRKTVPALNKSVTQLLALKGPLTPGIYYLTVFDGTVRYTNKIFIQ